MYSSILFVYLTEILTVRFRTSESSRFTGFRMVVICYRPNERDLPGNPTWHNKHYIQYVKKLGRLT